MTYSLENPAVAVTSATGRRDDKGVPKISFRSGVIVLRGSESDLEAREDPGGVIDPYEPRRSLVFSGLVR